MLRGAAYAAYRRGSTGQSPLEEGRGNPSVNYLLEALREAGDLVTAALGEERRQRLRQEGAVMTMEEAVSYALANIDPKLLTGPSQLRRTRGMTTHPPSGTVTFLLTDLEGSTRMWEQDPVAMKAAMVRHDEILEKAIAANNGYVFSRMGDGMAAAFATAGDAITSALAIERSLAEEHWRTAGPLKARIGLHTAESVIVDDTGYASLPITNFHRAARSLEATKPSAAPVGTDGGLVSQTLRETRELVETALGRDRARELRMTGAAMGLDEAVSFALANIDPKLLHGPIASIDR